ncbi:hypothetical protein [Klebsiella michiganensis]|uniref:hypothetical protein n=1 Tax=Klebsiella michiganensis TaxID=1134687 RepID=UPI0027C960C1|nr:hypothetical protein [Klebsiella michiganensis]ELJ6256767.1 hypothetical protein [Klebsiella michiganensis]MDQ2144746.1 hypothetical protein [Klebsiella michiganensis]MDV6972726.1 hypothetical protein [Klebsiella michiganensis]MDW5481905.1 hypothetical protein [Klebsiella michiganensis]MDW5496256.1 hypothetical protein [Klebsiella michiganensis]
MNIETVNELIQSLESAGELSIKETKVMALAKAYQLLAAENVGLKAKMDKLALWPGIEFYSSSWEFNNNDGNEALEFMCDIETPATDRIVAGIKADGVEALADRLQKHLDEGDFSANEVGVIAGAIHCGREMAQQLREVSK